MFEKFFLAWACSLALSIYYATETPFWIQNHSTLGAMEPYFFFYFFIMKKKVK